MASVNVKRIGDLVMLEFSAGGVSGRASMSEVEALNFADTIADAAYGSEFISLTNDEEDACEPIASPID